MRKAVWLLALACLFFSVAIPRGVISAAEIVKLQDCRLIINWDTCNMGTVALGGHEIEVNVRDNRLVGESAPADKKKNEGTK